MMEYIVKCIIINSKILVKVNKIAINDLNVINPYTQNPAAIAASKSTADIQPITATTSVGSTHDLSQFSQQALQALLAATQGSSSSTIASKDPLANLVSNGTIT